MIDNQSCTQIPIAEAVRHLLSDHREYTDWNAYRERYYRPMTPAELRAKYHDDGSHIIIAADRVERDDAPEPSNRPFQRFCMLSDAWRDRAFDITTKLQSGRE